MWLRYVFGVVKICVHGGYGVCLVFVMSVHKAEAEMVPVKPLSSYEDPRTEQQHGLPMA